MKRKIILPFDDYPIPSMYHYIAFPCSIVQANAGDQMEKWLCSQYINCYFKPSSRAHKFIISIMDGWSASEGVNIHQQINFSKEMFESLRLDPIVIMKKAILYGCYRQCAFQSNILWRV